LKAVGRIHGWPATLTEPDLLDARVVLRPVRVSDARAWREIRVRNASWLRPWEPSNPETPLVRSPIGPYVSMVRTMRREARQGVALPWVVTYGGAFAGQLTVGSIVWGSSRSGQIGYWIDEAYAGREIVPTALAMAVDHCFRSMGMHRLEASIRPENVASRRVVEKLGFREEGLRRAYLHIDGGWRDHIAYALTVQRDNKIVLGGRSGDYPTFNFAIARYTSAGQLDQTFGTGGKVLTAVSNDSNGYALTIAGGKITLAGAVANSQSPFDFGVARYLVR